MNNPITPAGLYSCPPPPYSVVDTQNPDGTKAVEFAQSMIRYSSDSQGRLNTGQLSSLLDMTIKYIQQEAGVLPSVVTGAAANNPASNNPTNPDLWDWDQWENVLFSGKCARGIRELGFRKRSAICKILDANIGPDEGKILELLHHPLFENSLMAAGIFTNTITTTEVRFIVKSRNCSSISSDLFRYYEPRGPIKPTGMIKSAIALGYLPKEDIDQLYQIAGR